MREYSWIVPFATLVAAIGCQAPEPSGSARSPARTAQRKEPPPANVQELASWMTGSFSSTEQAANDANFFDIRLHMTPIWSTRSDGPWLYVEQAAAAKLNEPYRQRVYRLVAQDDGTIESRVFTLPGDPLRFAGKWAAPADFETLKPEDLELRSGCSLYLRRTSDGAYVGSTQGQGCESSLRGAAYATSEARITESGMRTWDRGFDAQGQQVWGATTGGYEFRKVED
jgi:hypothetical protein